jgi:hypothetical protein
VDCVDADKAGVEVDEAGVTAAVVGLAPRC